MNRAFAALLLFAIGLAASPAAAQDWARLNGSFFDQLEYRHIGPVGNRVSAGVGVPGDPTT